MAFRDDRDALLARNDALQRQLEDAKQELADRDKEIELANNPPAEPEPEPAQERAKLRPKDQAQSGAELDTTARGVSLASEMISDDATISAAAKRELLTAPPVVTDAAAGVLAKQIREGGPDGEKVCRALSEGEVPRFGGGSYGKIFRALMKAREPSRLGSVAEAAMQKFIMRGMDDNYVEKKEKATGPGSTNPLVRALSVFGRAWVIVVWGLPALFLTIALIGSPGYRVHAGIALIALSALVIAIDSYKRRCPSCRKLLAGKRLSIVSDDYGGHILTWRCVFCTRTWKT